MSKVMIQFRIIAIQKSWCLLVMIAQLVNLIFIVILVNMRVKGK